MAYKYEPKTAMMGHQREALVKGWSTSGFGYLMDMGTGKSKVTIDNFAIL